MAKGFNFRADVSERINAVIKQIAEERGISPAEVRETAIRLLNTKEGQG